MGCRMPVTVQGPDDVIEGITPNPSEALTPSFWDGDLWNREIPLQRPAHVKADFYFPRDRAYARHCVEAYFQDLNPHRPVFVRHSFVEVFEAMYDHVENKPSQPSTRVKALMEDAGFLFSSYLVLALGALYEETKRQHAAQPEERPGFPRASLFGVVALKVKPYLLTGVTALQALILLHWYLYIEVSGVTYMMTSLSSPR